MAAIRKMGRISDVKIERRTLRGQAPSEVALRQSTMSNRKSSMLFSSMCRQFPRSLDRLRQGFFWA